jgi:hypothetical protein
VYLTLESSGGTPEEVAVKYNNFSTGTDFWWQGLNQEADYSVAYGSAYSGANVKFYIKTDGKVGIGTTAPNEALTVSGNISASGTVCADAFNSLTGGSAISFNDDVTLSGNISATNVCGTTSVCTPLVNGTTCITSPLVCGTTAVCTPYVKGSTCVCSPIVNGSTCVTSPLVCGTTSVNTPIVNGSTCVCSPLVCASTNVDSPLVCGTTKVCTPTVHGTTLVCGATVCGSTSVLSPLVCGTTSVNTPIVNVSSCVVAPTLSATNVCFPDNGKAYFGASCDLQLYHDGGNSYVSESGAGALVLQSNGTAIVLEKTDGENMILANTDGDVKLYYDGSEKLATTATGVDVTGRANASSCVTTPLLSATNVYTAGSVGVGTSVPTEALTVSGNISASGTVCADAFNSLTGGSTIDFNL